MEKLRNRATLAAMSVVVIFTSACGGAGTVAQRAQPASSRLLPQSPTRTVSTSGHVRLATGERLGVILARRSGIHAGQRSVRSGGAHGVSCNGGCTGGTYTIVSHGTNFNVGVTAPTSGAYQITGYTTDSHGVQTPIPNYTVNVTAGEAGPSSEVNASVFIGGGVDMSNGISITITGPNGDSNEFDNTCDTGSGSWDYSPWDQAHSGD